MGDWTDARHRLDALAVIDGDVIRCDRRQQGITKD